jgi:protein SCO1/2
MLVMDGAKHGEASRPAPEAFGHSPVPRARRAKATAMKRAGIFALFLLLAGCGRGAPGVTDITGVMPDLQFSMTRANDGAAVTAQSYRGKVVILYFGYTHCPDICPATLANMANVFKQLGPRANGVRMLFVSVDPNRDTPALLKSYVSAFAPQIDGLRGTPDQLARLARRYRVIYSVTPNAGDYEVMHSSAVFFFDGKGHARFVTTETDDTSGIAQGIKRIVSSE